MFSSKNEHLFFKDKKKSAWFNNCMQFLGAPLTGILDLSLWTLGLWSIQVLYEMYFKEDM